MKRPNHYLFNFHYRIKNYPVLMFHNLLGSKFCSHLNFLKFWNLLDLIQARLFICYQFLKCWAVSLTYRGVVIATKAGFSSIALFEPKFWKKNIYAIRGRRKGYNFFNDAYSIDVQYIKKLQKSINWGRGSGLGVQNFDQVCISIVCRMHLPSKYHVKIPPWAKSPCLSSYSR